MTETHRQLLEKPIWSEPRRRQFRFSRDIIHIPGTSPKTQILCSSSPSSTENINEEGESLAREKGITHFTDQTRDAFYYGNNDVLQFKGIHSKESAFHRRIRLKCIRFKRGETCKARLFYKKMRKNFSCNISQEEEHDHDPISMRERSRRYQKCLDTLSRRVKNLQETMELLLTCEEENETEALKSYF